MIRIKFSEEEKQMLNHERYRHPHPRVRQKMEALWLKSQELPHQEICRLADISENTLRAYLQEYIEGGIKRVKEIRFCPPQSELEKHRSVIEAHFREHPPATIKEACARIEDLTGIKRSSTQVRQFLRSMGMKCLKVGMIPAKADPEVQEEFKNNELEPRLKEAQEGKRAVFFVDAAHFVLSPFLGFLWCFARVWIQAPCGRQRFNVLGALDAVTHKLITVTNDTYINSQSVCELLMKIAVLNLQIPITLILDNARYQRCLLVQSFAQELGIELLFLPSYSPNLNLIERFWKFIKKECLYSKYYSDFTAFKEAILSCIDNAHTKHKKDLDSLLTLKFQSFKKPGDIQKNDDCCDEDIEFDQAA